MKPQRTLVIVGGVLLLTVTLCLTSVYAQEKKIVFASWGGTWDEAAKKAFTDPFEKETGIKVVYAGINPSSAKIKAMVESGNVEWDVTQNNVQASIPLVAQGLLEPIDYSIVNKKVLFPEAVHSHLCGGVYEGVVLAYRTDAYKDKPPTSWKDFFDVEKFPGPRSMFKSIEYILEIALLADGVPPDKLYPLDVDRAFAKLDRIKPHITTWYTLGAQLMSLLSKGEVDMVSGWNGRIAQLMMSGERVAMSWNQGLYSQSAWYVIKNAPHKKEAMQFIDFTCRPQNQAINSSMIYYGFTNPEAIKYMDEKVAKLTPSYPDNLKKCVALDTPFWEKNYAKLNERFSSWILK